MTRWSRWNTCIVRRSDSSPRKSNIPLERTRTLASLVVWAASCSLQSWSLFKDYPEMVSEHSSVLVCRNKTEIKMKNPSSRNSWSSWPADYQFVKCPCLLICLFTFPEQHDLENGIMVWEQEDGRGMLSPQEVFPQQPLLHQPRCEHCVLLPTSTGRLLRQGVKSRGRVLILSQMLTGDRPLSHALPGRSISCCPTQVFSSTLLGWTKKIRKVIRSWTHISLQCTYIGTESQNCSFREIRDCVGISPNANRA